MIVEYRVACVNKRIVECGIPINTGCSARDKIHPHIIIQLGINNSCKMAESLAHCVVTAILLLSYFYTQIAGM